MIKMCILGNSHVASLKSAWDEIFSQYPQINITFFAIRQRALAGLSVKNGLLMPNNESLKQALSFTSNGKEYINPNEFDACLLYGLDLEPYQAPSTFYSHAVLTSLMRGILDGSVSWGLIHKIREINNIPIFVGHTPLSAASDDTKQHDDTSAYQAGIIQLNQTFFNPLNATIIKQPKGTIVNNFNTQRAYSIGSRRLDLGDEMSNQLHDEIDTMHMNVDFGICYLKALFASSGFQQAESVSLCQDSVTP